MPLKTEEIKKNRERISKIGSNLDKVKAISMLHPKINVPVVIAILKDCLSVLSNENQKETVQTRTFLDYAIQLLSDVNVKQNANILQLRKTLKEFTKEKIIKDMSLLVDYGKQVHITDNAAHLWLEVTLWLEGMYRRTYDMVAKEKDGVTVLIQSNGFSKTIDAEDKLFFTIVGLTKYSIASYYHEASVSLSERLLKYYQDRNQKFSRDFYKNVDVTHDVLDPNIQVIEQNASPKDYLPDAYLQEFQNDNKEIKFLMLIYAVENFQLQDHQADILNKFKSNVMATLTAYINSSYTTLGVPTMFVSRPHTKRIESELSTFRKKNDLGFLNSLYELWLELKSKNSEDAYNKVTDLLNDTFTLLLKLKEPVKQRVCA